MLSRFPIVMHISGFLLNRELLSVKSELILLSKVSIMCYFQENGIIRERKKLTLAYKTQNHTVSLQFFLLFFSEQNDISNVSSDQ